ncbi:MAG: M48 family metalloprotease [Candidatus Moranbacteria bacterium]|nr:M48 family metalloprotease [Candidatus Moranbacteria bacterium]
MNNTIKTILLFGSFAAVLIAIGNYLGGFQGLVTMSILGILINLGAYFFSDKIAIMTARAKPLDQSRFARITQMVQDLAKKADLPMPKLYLSPNPQPNAFATGRNPQNAAVCVTEGLIKHLNQDEIKGVLAHELAHVKNRDILIQTLAAVFGSIITSASYLLRFVSFGSDNQNRSALGDIAIIILAPIAAIIIQLAISRSREYAADKTGAKIAGNPNGLADALGKIESLSKSGYLNPKTVNPAFENLYIANPLGNQGITGALSKLFSTHPPVKDRISKLRGLA